MNKEDVKTTWFKAELRAYYHAQPIIKDLKDQIAVLDNRLEYHSPNLSGERGVPQSHDEKLAKYITIRDRYVKQLEVISSQYERITAILSLIEEDDRESIINVYSGASRLEEEANARGYCVEALRWRINAVIVKAVNKYLGHG